MIVNDSPICLSGGARGADAQWGMTAGMAGHLVIHWSFSGHKVHVPSSEVVELTDEQLAEADPYLQRANLTLKRHFPPKNRFATNLLRRNWYQVRDAESVYAVSSIQKGIVQGGTAWAVQMFIDRHDGRSCPVYVYDQDSSGWQVWTCDGWQPANHVPKPTGVWAGIGSRDLTEDGKQAIRTLMEWSRGLAIMQDG